MAVTVLVSGIPHHVTLSNLAYNLNYLFDTDEIGSFKIRDILNNGPKRQIALDFKSGFDAMTAQDMLDGYRYEVHNEEYVLKAKITNNESLLPNSSVSWYKDQSLSLISKYSEKSYAQANQKLDSKLLFLKKQKLVVDAERELIKSKKRLAREYKKRTVSTSSEEEKPKKRRKKSKRDSSESSLSDAECSKTRAIIRSTIRKSSRSRAKKSKSRKRSRTRTSTPSLNKLPPGQIKCLENIKFEPEGTLERARSRHRRDRKSSSTDRGSPLRLRRSPLRLRRSPSRVRRSPSRVRRSPSRSRYSPLRQIYSSSRQRHTPPRHRHSPSPEFQSPLREIHSPSPREYYTDYYSNRKKSSRVDSHHRKYSDERDRDSNYYRAPSTSHHTPASIDLKEEINELKLREIKAAIVQEIMTENTKYLQSKMNEIGDAVTDADFNLIIAEVKEVVEKKFRKLVVAKCKSIDEVFNMYKKEFDCSDDFKLIQKLLDEILAFNSKFMSGSNKFLQTLTTAKTVSLSPKKSISQPLPTEDNNSQGLQQNSNKDKSVEQIWCMVDEVLHDIQIDDLGQEDAEENINKENTNLNLASINNDPTPEQQSNVIVSNKPPAAPETTEKNITITDKDVLNSVHDDITEDKERSTNDNLNVETVSVQQTGLSKEENNVIDLTNDVYDVITTKGADSLNNLQTESVIVIKRERQDVYHNNGDSLIEPELVVPIKKIMNSFRSAIRQLEIPPEKYEMFMEFIKLLLLVELRNLLDKRPIMAAKNVVEIFRLYHPIHEDKKYLSEIFKNMQSRCFAHEKDSEYKNISAKDIQNNELVVLKTRNVPAIEHDNDVIHVENDPVVIEIYDDDTQNNELVLLKTRNVPVIDNDVTYVENNPVVIEIYDDEPETINKFSRRSTAVSNQKDKQANITTSLGSTNVISSNTSVIVDAKTNMTVQNNNRRNKTAPSINTKNTNRLKTTTNRLSNIKINQNKNANRKTIHFTNNTKSCSYNPYEDKSSNDYIVTAILNIELYLICGIAKSSGINPYIMPGFVTALKSIISNRLDSCLPYLISTYGRLDLTIVRDYYRSYYPLTSNVVLLQQLLYNLFGIHHHINHTEGSSTNTRQITERNPLDTPDKNELKVNTDKKDKVTDIVSNSNIKKSQNKLETENKKIEDTLEDDEETIECIENFLASLN